MKDNDVWVEMDQSVHGRDFWQADYDTQTGTWKETYTVPPGRQVNLCIAKEYQLMRNKE